MDEMFGNLSVHTKNYINFMVDMAVEKAEYDPKRAAEALMELRKYNRAAVQVHFHRRNGRRARIYGFFF